ncbi:angiotensin-converting enzyme-like [Physella acuta]|uniref:angiotensin-converting enzyme-like n=1 Tax=Physella acuta TaxID=109671 RepID=UPI0027DD4318|nr:angiotensin-converting enzyme-like [Physella acuta]
MKLEVWLLLFAYASLATWQSEARNTSPEEFSAAKRSEKADPVNEVKRAEKCGLAKNVTCKTTVAEAKTFLQAYDTKAAQVRNRLSEADFTHKTNMTDYNAELLTAAEVEKAKFEKEQRVLALEFDVTKMPDDIQRQFQFIKNIGPSAEQNQTKVERLKNVQTEIETIYNTGKVCLNSSYCLELSTGLSELMASSRDYDLLLKAWKGWRDVTGAQMKDKYAEYVSLLNDAVKPSGYKDAGEYWRSWYESATFEHDLAELFAQIKPLYEQLHAYVRSHLKKKYGADKFPTTGHIPAHILGNMWGQAWNSLIDLVLPYPDKPKLDVTEELQRQVDASKAG